MGGATLYMLSKVDLNELAELNPDDETIYMKNVMESLDKQINNGGVAGPSQKSAAASSVGGSVV